MLDLRNVYATKNNILKNLLSKYVGLRFIGVNQDFGNRPEYVTDVLTTGWYYSPETDASTGQTNETLKIVESNTTLRNVCLNSSMVELRDGNGDFLRFTIKARRPPKPPGVEWLFEIQPNPQDKRVIT